MLFLVAFIAELDDTQGDYGTAQAILYTLLRLPNLAFEMLPVAVLIGSLLAFVAALVYLPTEKAFLYGMGRLGRWNDRGPFPYDELTFTLDSRVWENRFPPSNRL